MNIRLNEKKNTTEILVTSFFSTLLKSTATSLKCKNIYDFICILVYIICICDTLLSYSLIYSRIF